MKPDAILYFAAGFGTRMGALTQTRPKPLVPVAGRALIDHARDLAAPVGPLREVANAHYRADQLIAHLRGTKVVVSNEQPDVLETGGGIKNALTHVGAGPIYTLNTDAIWSDTSALATCAQAWDPARMDALLLCVPLSRALGRSAPGDFSMAPEGGLSWGGDMVYTGAQIIKTETIATYPETAFSLHPIWRDMQARGRLFGTEYQGRWCDVGRPENIALAESLIADV